MNRRTWLALGVALGLAIATWWTARAPADSHRAAVAVRSPESPAPDVSQTAALRTVRVLLGGGPRSSWKVRIDGPYQVTAVDHWKVLAQGPRLTSYDVQSSDAGIQIGDRTFDASAIHIRVIESGALWVGERRYRGDLRLIRQHGDKLSAINLVPLERYVASVVAGEMPDAFPPSARQAQAIVARSYVLWHQQTSGQASQFDVYDSPRSQNYQGMEARRPSGELWKIETPLALEAAQLTEGMVCTFRGKLFCTYYHAVCGGGTLHGHQVFPEAAPPLLSVPCQDCQPGPHYHWNTSLSHTELERRLDDYLRPQGRTLGALLDIEMVLDGTDTAHGVPSQVRLIGEKQALVMDGVELQFRVFSGVLRSPCFRIEKQEETYQFVGRGWGHGVGMCQWGAKHRGAAGRDCLEILRYYYPGCDLTVVR